MNARPARLTVIVHDVPPPSPRPGELVEVVLDGVPENAIEGRVVEGIGMGFGVIRVEIPPGALEAVAE